MRTIAQIYDELQSVRDSLSPLLLRERLLVAEAKVAEECRSRVLREEKRKQLEFLREAYPYCNITDQYTCVGKDDRCPHGPHRKGQRRTT